MKYSLFIIFFDTFNLFPVLADKYFFLGNITCFPGTEASVVFLKAEFFRQYVYTLLEACPHPTHY